MRQRQLSNIGRQDRNDPLRSLQREVERLFGNFAENGAGGNEWPLMGDQFVPPLDVEERDAHYVLCMDLPGLTKNDVNVEVNDNVLRVFGERKEERREPRGPGYRSERVFGTFERIMTLPQDVNPDEVEAHFENGVLRIAIPKAETANRKQIPVSEGRGGIFAKLLGKKDERNASSSGERGKVA